MIEHSACKIKDFNHQTPHCKVFDLDMRCLPCLPSWRDEGPSIKDLKKMIYFNGKGI